MKPAKHQKASTSFSMTTRIGASKSLMPWTYPRTTNNRYSYLGHTLNIIRKITEQFAPDVDGDDKSKTAENIFTCT